MIRTTCRDQRGGIRLLPHTAVQSALDNIAALRDHPSYGAWARATIHVGPCGAVLLPGNDIIQALDRLGEAEEAIHGPLTVPTEEHLEDRNQPRCYRCAHFCRYARTGFGYCWADDRRVSFNTRGCESYAPRGKEGGGRHEPRVC